MAQQLIWREATKEEIEQGLDHPSNPGMVLVEIIEIPEQQE